jgi:hypothetical protein
VSQVYADAPPGRPPATHRVDQHVVHGKLRGGSGVARLPALETRERLVLVLGLRDRNQRVYGLAAASALAGRG